MLCRHPHRGGPATTVSPESARESLGAVASVLIGIRLSRRSPVRAPENRKLAWRIFWFWVLLFAYVWLWMLFGQWTGLRLGAFLCTAIMFAYVVMGLWLDAMVLFWTGLAVTCMAVFAYFVLPAYFTLWMGLTGGGTLLGTGLYIRRYWR